MNGQLATWLNYARNLQILFSAKSNFNESAKFVAHQTFALYGTQCTLKTATRSSLLISIIHTYRKSKRETIVNNNIPTRGKGKSIAKYWKPSKWAKEYASSTTASIICCIYLHILAAWPNCLHKGMYWGCNLNVTHVLCVCINIYICRGHRYCLWCLSECLWMRKQGMPPTPHPLEKYTRTLL